MYTSGTTGNPKGVMLSHDNIIFNGSIMALETMEHTPNEQNVQPEDMRTVSYLPLSHIAGMQADLIQNALTGSILYFARPDALQGTLVDSL